MRRFASLEELCRAALDAAGLGDVDVSPFGLAAGGAGGLTVAGCRLGGGYRVRAASGPTEGVPVYRLEKLDADPLAPDPGQRERWEWIGLTQSLPGVLANAACEILRPRIRAAVDAEEERSRQAAGACRCGFVMEMGDFLEHGICAPCREENAARAEAAGHDL